MGKRFTDTEKFNDKWYRKLPILQKVIWEYLLAECNHAGILEKFDIELMSFKIGTEITEEDLKIFGNRIIFISDSVIFIPKFIKFQYGELNPQSKVHASVLKELEKYNIDTLSIGYGKGIDTLKDKNKDKDKDKNTNSSTKFTKPCIEEIQKYCLERKNNVNPNQFYDFYESKNWFIGKNKMKDWRAAVRTWERNGKGKIEIESNNLSKFYETGETARIEAIRNEIIDETASRLAMEKCAKKVEQLRRGEYEQTRRGGKIFA